MASARRMRGNVWQRRRIEHPPKPSETPMVAACGVGWVSILCGRGEALLSAV